VATTGRYIMTNLQVKREAMQAFCTKAGIEPAGT
jgi:integrase/recombinase XerD